MRDLPCQTHFLMEAREAVGSIGHVPWQELEGDRLSKFQVLCPIPLTHAASAEQADDAVAFNQHRAQYELRAVDRTGRGRKIGYRPCVRVRVLDVRAACRTEAARVRNVAMARRALHS